MGILATAAILFLLVNLFIHPAASAAKLLLVLCLAILKQRFQFFIAHVELVVFLFAVSVERFFFFLIFFILRRSLLRISATTAVLSATRRLSVAAVCNSVPIRLRRGSDGSTIQ